MIYYYYCTCVCICVISHVPQHVCDGQRTACRSKFSPSFCNVSPGDGAQVIGVIWEELLLTQPSSRPQVAQFKGSI